MLLNANTQTEKIFKSGGSALIFLYVLFGGMSLFNENVISYYTNSFIFLFFVSFLIYLYRNKKNTENYRCWHSLKIGCVFIVFLMCVFFNYSSYWYKYSYKISILLFSIQILSFFISYLLGNARVDFKKQSIELRKNIKLMRRSDPNLEEGVIYIKEYKGKIFTYKKKTDSLVLDFIFRVVKYTYLTVFILVFLIGSGSSLIIIEAIENYIPLESNVSPHHIVMYVFSLIVIPILAYYLPAIMSAIRWWKNLEADIQEHYGKVVYVWPDEQETSTPIAESKP